MKRSFLLIGGGLLTGSFLASQLSIFQLTVVICFIIIICFICVLINTKAKTSALAFVLFCIIGSCMFVAKDHYEYNKIVNLDNTTQNITATIKSINQNKSNRFSYELSIQSIENSNIKNFNTILYTNKYIDADLYDTISLKVDFFKPISNNSFDSVNYYKSKQIYLLSSHYDNSEELTINIIKNKNKPFIYYVKSYNNYLSQIIDNNFNPNSSSIIKSMLLGNSEDIPYSLENKYNTTSTSHIFAISGLHISILSLLILKLTKKCPFLFRAVFPAIPIVFYILVSGCQISAIRSGFMLLILVLSKLSLRKTDLLNTLFLTGFVIVSFNVYSIIDISFCMSFLATLGIILLADKLTLFFILKCNMQNFSLFAVKCISVSISANIFLMPFWIYTFKTFNLISPLINLSISFLPPIILCLSFLYIIICPINQHNIINFILDTIISLQNGIIDIFFKLDYFSIGLDYEIFNKWLLFSIALIIIFIFIKQNLNTNIRLKHLCICICVTFIISYASTFIQNLNSYLFVVGSGETSNIIINDKNTTTVISTSDDGYIDNQTVQFLKGKGINKIDNLILSYTTFNEYQDTLSLVSSIEVKNVLFNQNNTNAFNVLTTRNPNFSILPIEDKMQIQINDNIILNFSYVIKNINIDIKYNNSNIYICDANSVESNRENTLFFVRGNSDNNYTVNKNLVFSLQKPYDYNNKDNNIEILNPVYDKNSTFIIK